MNSRITVTCQNRLVGWNNPGYYRDDEGQGNQSDGRIDGLAARARLFTLAPQPIIDDVVGPLLIVCAARGARGAGVGGLLARVSRRRDSPRPVVSLATFGIDQRVISLIDLSEFPLGSRIGVDVGMIFARQPAVSGLISLEVAVRLTPSTAYRSPISDMPPRLRDGVILRLPQSV